MHILLPLNHHWITTESPSVHYFPWSTYLLSWSLRLQARRKGPAEEANLQRRKLQQPDLPDNVNVPGMSGLLAVFWSDVSPWLSSQLTIISDVFPWPSSQLAIISDVSPWPSSQLAITSVGYHLSCFSLAIISVDNVITQFICNECFITCLSSSIICFLIDWEHRM